MRQSPLNLIRLIILFVIGCWPLEVRAGEGDAPAVAPPSAADLLSQSARQLFDTPALAVEFRFHLRQYEESLQGTGQYFHEGTGPEKNFRLELKTQLDDRAVSMLSICDRQFIWIRRDFGPDHSSLSRVSLRRLKKAIDDSRSSLVTDPSPTWMGMVSLPKFLGMLNNWYVYDPPRPARIGDREAWQLSGQMDTSKRDKFLTLGRREGQGREQIPQSLRVTLGRDPALPLFPYRIEFFSALQPQAVDLPVATLDFYSVKVKSELEPQLFHYVPGDQEVEDITIPFLQRLGFDVRD